MTEPRWIPLSERKPEISCLQQKQYTFSDGVTHWWDYDIPKHAKYWLQEYLPPLPKEEKPVDADWQRLDRSFDKWFCRPSDVNSTNDFIEDVYIFLKAKYGNRS